MFFVKERADCVDICCLNTGLIYLIFAKRNSSLAPTVQQFGEYDISLGRANTYMLENVKKLLSFWKEYYYPSDKDCQSLELSSRVPFSEWIETVEVAQQLVGNALKPAIKE